MASPGPSGIHASHWGVADSQARPYQFFAIKKLLDLTTHSALVYIDSNYNL